MSCAYGEISHSGNPGPHHPAMARHPFSPPGMSPSSPIAVTVRCLVAGNGPVPDADDAPGNVAVVARAD